MPSVKEEVEVGVVLKTDMETVSPFKDTKVESGSLRYRKGTLLCETWAKVWMILTEVRSKSLKYIYDNFTLKLTNLHGKYKLLFLFQIKLWLMT